MKKFLIVLVVLIVAAVVIGFFLPREFEVSREIVINADRSDVHKYAGDLKKWDDWMPWKDQDPSIVITIGDDHEGVGASQTWTGKEGEGEIVFTMSDDDRGVEYDMSFDQGKIKSKGSILYEKIGDTTRVTWTMKGEWPMPVVGGYMVLVMKPMIGSSFEDGLSKLKDKVEND